MKAHYIHRITNVCYTILIAAFIGSCSASNNEDRSSAVNRSDSTIHYSDDGTIQKKDYFLNGQLRKTIKYDPEGNPVWIGYLNEHGDFIKFINNRFSEENILLSQNIQLVDYSAQSELAMYRIFDDNGGTVLIHFRKTDLKEKEHLYKITMEYAENGKLREVFLYDTPSGSQRQLYEEGKLRKIIYYSKGINADERIIESDSFPADSLVEAVRQLEGLLLKN